jgi:hypothetical protein
MKRSLLLSVFAVALLGTVAGMMIFHQLSSSMVTAQAAGASAFAPGQLEKLVGVPTPVGNWFGIARPCPATGPDAGHGDFCAHVCGMCDNSGKLPDEVPMMPMIHADGTVTVNDAVSISVFHTTAQGAWAADPDPNQYQIPGRQRYQASFIWLDGNPNHEFDGVVRPRFVTYFDPNNPNNMIGYIQPHFFATNGNPLTPTMTMFINPGGRPGGSGGLDLTNHYPAVDFLAQLPQGCQVTDFSQGWSCLGTYHFTLARQTANVPN